jgi:hypothetical protein
MEVGNVETILALGSHGADGRYSIGLKPGVYDVFFSFPIFSPVAVKVKLEAGKTVDFDTKLKLDHLTNTVPFQVR